MSVLPNPEYSPPIPPLPEGTPRPKWSVMIPTFNCAELLRETLGSVLAQTPGVEQMQIEVVDDCSTDDDPETVVRELGEGRVEFFRQPQNLGHTENFNSCIRRSRGHLVHLLHGDDLILPGFYTAMGQGFSDDRVGMAFCRHVYINEAGRQLQLGPAPSGNFGVLRDALSLIATTQPIQTPAVVVRRTVYEELGGFDGRMLSCGEDWEMWVRVASHFSVTYEPSPLAAYRVREGSLSGRSFRSGQNIRDLLQAIEIYGEYIPRDQRRVVVRRARRRAATWGLHLAKSMLRRGDWTGAGVQLRAAVGAMLYPKAVGRSQSLGESPRRVRR